jgi:hypothetical protein
MCSRLFRSHVLVCLIGCLACFAAANSASAETRETLAQLRRQQKAFESAFKQANLETATAAVEAIGGLDSPKGIDFLLSLAYVRPQELYLAVVKAIPGSRSAEMTAFLLELYRRESKKPNPQWEKRVMLLDALETMPAEDVLPAFELAVRDDHPKVRLAAIRGLAVLGGPPAKRIPLWIDSLRSSERAFDMGTPHVEARSHLFEQTGQDYRDEASWAKFWQTQLDTFTPPENPPEGSIEYGSEAQYYGAAITSRRVLFIVDTSGSMNTFEYEGWPNVPQVPYSTGGTPGVGLDTTVGGSGGTVHPLWIRWLADNPLCVRIDRAKAELIRLIDTLPPGTQFNVVSFDSKPAVWQQALVPAEPPTKEGAKRFVQKLQPDGSTAADLALALGFKSSHAADTIYFLSDGEPSRDGINPLPWEQLVEEVTHTNRFHRIIIHTLGFGAGGEPFMQLLAEKNGGEYRQIVGPPEWLEK